jgi:hypothetical protein
MIDLETLTLYAVICGAASLCFVWPAVYFGFVEVCRAIDRHGSGRSRTDARDL